MIGWPCIVVLPWLISNLMHKILIYLHIIHLLKSSTCVNSWWLVSVHHSTTLVDLQRDPQNSYLFTYNTFIKILYIFRELLWPSSGGPLRNRIHAVSGIITLCRWLSCLVLTVFLNRCTGQSPADSDDTRDRIYTIEKWTSWSWAG